jgi:sulfotransferase family protein
MRPHYLRQFAPQGTGPNSAQILRLAANLVESPGWWTPRELAASMRVAAATLEEEQAKERRAESERLRTLQAQPAKELGGETEGLNKQEEQPARELGTDPEDPSKPEEQPARELAATPEEPSKPVEYQEPEPEAEIGQPSEPENQPASAPGTETDALSKKFLMALRRGVDSSRALQKSEDPFTQGALNGQDFVHRFVELDPHIRAGLAELLTHQGVQYHKLAIAEQVARYAVASMQLPPSDIAFARLYGVPEGNTLETLAERYYRLALQVDPQNAMAHFNLGTILARNSQIPDAIVHLEAAALSDGYYRAFADFRIAALETDASAVAERWRGARASTMHFGQYHVDLAEGLRQSGDIEAALEEFGRSLDFSHHYSPAFIIRTAPITDAAEILQTAAPARPLQSSEVVEPPAEGAECNVGSELVTPTEAAPSALDEPVEREAIPPKNDDLGAQLDALRAERQQVWTELQAYRTAAGLFTQSEGEVDIDRSIPNIFLCCAPKSAGLYIRNYLMKGLKLEFRRLSVNYWPEDILSIPACENFFRSTGCIAFNHTDAGETNIAVLEQGRQKVALNVRDPRESILSLVHYQLLHFPRGSRLFHPNEPPDDYVNWTNERRIDFFIDGVFIKYIRWMTDWLDIADAGALDVLVTRYEDLVTDESGLFRRILEFYGIPETKLRQPNVPKDRASNFRSGRIGEWREVFTPRQTQRVTRAIPSRLFARFGWQP